MAISGIPPTATSLEVEFQFLSATTFDQGRVVVTPEMLNLQWTAVALYPAGHFVRQIQVEPSIRLPDGWQMGTALRVASLDENKTVFEQVSFEDLIDSPVFAGRYFKRIDLDPGADTSVYMNIVADEAEQLEITPEQLDIHRALVEEAYALFGSHHYDHYDFLVALTERMGGIGLEHHQSSENSFGPTLFTDWDSNATGRDLLAHEYTHSWNGKFRRPADLWTPDFAMPMRGSLLWVYEGQTQYWGNVLAARSGLHSQQEALDGLAMTAASFEYRVGREWRSLGDTTNDPVAAGRQAQGWRSWSRSEDYYSEGLLIWLDADTLIRELSKGRRSLDDFASTFFGVNDGSRIPVTYEFDDVVAALNAVQEYNWETFLRDRVDRSGTSAPLDGIERGGYKLEYTDTPSEHHNAVQAYYEYVDLRYSIGIALAMDGSIGEVIWDGPAYKEGLTVGYQVIAVNGFAFTVERLIGAISDAKDSDATIDLIVADGDHYRTLSMAYHDGLRYPHLVRKDKKKASLDRILKSKR